jgi:hypothetical protein
MYPHAWLNNIFMCTFLLTKKILEMIHGTPYPGSYSFVCSNTCVVLLFMSLVPSLLLTRLLVYTMRLTTYYTLLVLTQVLLVMIVKNAYLSALYLAPDPSIDISSQIS